MVDVSQIFRRFAAITKYLKPIGTILLPWCRVSNPHRVETMEILPEKVGSGPQRDLFHSHPKALVDLVALFQGFRV